MASNPVGGYHRRVLPSPAIATSSAFGQTLHREALLDGGMACYFRLAETFHTQDEPAFCGLGTLVNVLNALEVDPGVLWKGSWRWFSERMLDCCVDLEEIKVRGMTLDEWACLGRCQGLLVELSRATDSSLEAFRAAVVDASQREDAVLCVSYTRRPLGQTGDGHFSPLAGYHAGSDRVLLLDVARYKYPPHWLPLSALWEAMVPVDGATGKSRGFARLSRNGGGMPATATVQLNFGRGRLSATRAYFAAAALEPRGERDSPADEVWRVVRGLPATTCALVALRESEACDALRGTELHSVLSEQRICGPLPLGPYEATALLLVVNAVVGDDALRAAMPVGLSLVRAAEAHLAGRSCSDEIDLARTRLALLIASADQPSCKVASADPCCALGCGKPTRRVPSSLCSLS